MPEASSCPAHKNAPKHDSSEMYLVSTVFDFNPWQIFARSVTEENHESMYSVIDQSSTFALLHRNLQPGKDSPSLPVFCSIPNPPLDCSLIWRGYNPLVLKHKTQHGPIKSLFLSKCFTLNSAVLQSAGINVCFLPWIVHK